MALRKPNVTIFADASHDHKARVAGWGAWIKADGRSSITCGAAMKGAVASTTEAELCALANALTVARLRGVLSRRCVVMMQSDAWLHSPSSAARFPTSKIGQPLGVSQL